MAKGIASWLLGATLLASGFGVATAAETPPAQQQTVSPKVSKPLSEAHAAITAEKWDEGMKLLRQAQSIDGRTDYDNHQIDEMMAFVQVRQGDYQNAAVNFERGLNSPYFAADRIDERLRVLVQLNYEIKNYTKAVEFGNRLLANIKTPDSELRSMVGRAQYLGGDYKGAVQSMDRAIEEAKATNKPVNETWLQVQLSSYVEMKDNAGVLSSLERLSIQFPKKKYWDDLFRILRRQSDADQRVQFNVYRLMFDAGLLQEPEDYVQSARIALRLGIPGEAVAMLEQGKTRNVFTGETEEERGRQVMQEAKEAAAADRKTLTALEQEARASKNGEADVQLGIAFMSYGQYDKAVEAIQRGQKKGGLKHGSEADLVLGRSLFKLDRKSEAEAAFQRAADAGQRSDNLSRQLGTIANLWLVYLRQPSVVTT